MANDKTPIEQRDPHGIVCFKAATEAELRAGLSDVFEEKDLPCRMDISFIGRLKLKDPEFNEDGITKDAEFSDEYHADVKVWDPECLKYFDGHPLRIDAPQTPRHYFI